ncbi:MAG: hypothetical protein QGI50_16355, partial [Dehalococcoidia bacterium]|nr:hypothetical protein [Dehalococcoidia bacterium]
FGLSRNETHCVVSKMMISGDLCASWDQPTDSVMMHKTEPSPIQQIALRFAARATAFVESNERLLDSRTGGYGGNDRWNRGGGRGGAHGGGRGGARGRARVLRRVVLVVRRRRRRVRAPGLAGPGRLGAVLAGARLLVPRR